MNRIETAAAIKALIKSMGWEEDHNFADTPMRVATWYHVYNGLSKHDIEQHITRHMAKRFKTDYDGMVAVGPTKVFSLCPHHLLPIEYDVDIGILLNEWALGLSKYTRIAIELARYPFIQEDYTKYLAEALEKGLDCKGTIVVVRGVHNCMRCRGVKDLNAVTKTSHLTGVFAKPPKGKNPREEFLELINLGR